MRPSFHAAFIFRRRDVPIRSALSGDCTKNLAEILKRRAAEEPIAAVDLVDDKARFQNNDLGNHGIVIEVGVFGNIKIFLNNAPGVGKEWPVGADARAVLVGQSDVVSADRDQTAVSNFHLAMELDQEFGLTAILGTITTTAEHQNHRMLALELRKLAALRGVIGQVVVKEVRTRNHVGSHGYSNPHRHVMQIENFEPGRRGPVEWVMVRVPPADAQTLRRVTGEHKVASFDGFVTGKASS